LPRSAVRIAYVSPAGEIGGMETNLLAELRHLDRRRFTPFVACLADGPFVNELRPWADAVGVYPRGRLRSILAFSRTIVQLARFLRAIRADLVVAENAVAHLYAYPAARLAGSRSVLRIGGIGHRVNPVEFIAYRLRASLVVANSDFTASYLRDSGVPADRLVVIHRGVDCERLRADNHRSKLRSELGIPPYATLITVIGRLQRGKGQHVFIEAAQRILEECPDAVFMIVGDALFGLDPDYPQELQLLGKRMGIEDQLIFTGFRHDVANLLDISDIVVTPSIEPEGFGMAVAEAMAAGKPLVATNLGATPELVTNGESALLVRPNDHQALAEAVIRLAKDEPLRVRLALNGRQAALKHFSIARAVNEYQHAYTEVLRP
jgi:glycosyltransferase involved in cell wall biosynthesis